MRKTAMVVVCLLLATVILVVFTANGMKKPVSGQIPFESKVVYANYSDSEKLASSPLNCSADKESLPIQKCTSTGDLKNFRQDLSNVLSFSQGYDEMPCFDDIEGRYNDSFFKSKALLIVYVASGSGSYRFNCDGIEADGGNVQITIKKTNNPEVVTCDMAGWFICVEVNRGCVVDPTSFSAK